MGKSIRANYIYNLIYEVFMLIVPLAITPYIARVLGDKASGQYSYVFSVVTYFTLFAALGFTKTAQRAIASKQGSENQRLVFWNIFIARLFPSSISIIVYEIIYYAGCWSEKYRVLAGIMLIHIVSVVLDITYYFQGNERFDVIVFRSIAIKSMGFICIFVFVRDETDLWKYALIQAMIVLLNNILLWIYIPSNQYIVNIRELEPLKYLPEALFLFVPSIATTIYTVLDKTLIGIITNDDIENGNYEYAERIVKMALTAITSLGTVMIPRNAFLYSKGDHETIHKNIVTSLKFVFFAGVPLTFGLVAIADSFIPLYLGEEYNKAILITKILSPLIIIIGISNVFGIQWLMATKQDKKYTISISFGAIINLILNIHLIRVYASYGAAFSSVISELIITMIMAYYSSDAANLLEIISTCWKNFIAGIVMFLICRCISWLCISTIVSTMITILVGVVVYIGMLIVLKDDFFKTHILKRDNI